MNRTKSNPNQHLFFVRLAASASLTLLLTTFVTSPSSAAQPKQEKTQEAKQETPQPAKQEPTQKATASYVGSETCAGCHEDQANWLKGSVHDEAAVAARHRMKGGCESCHGPGSIHAEEPSKENILTFSTEPANRRSQACLSCHGQHAGLLDFHRTKHRVDRIACDQCHGSTSSQAFHEMRSVDDRALEPQTATCESCHADKRSQFSMPFRHRVNEGLIGCGDCHREHTGFATGRRRTEQRNDTCVSCHSELQGPFVYEHEPMRVGGCTTCHEPHGSTNSRLLVRSDILTLCLECHTTTPEFHDLSQAKFRNCTICHTAVHGSNHNPLFLD